MNKKALIYICLLFGLLGGSLKASELEKSTIKIINTTSTDQRISGSQFAIMDESGTVIDTVITDEQGLASSDPLEPGKYQVQQIEIEGDYQLNPTIVDIELNQNIETYTATFINDEKSGDLTVTDNYSGKNNRNNNYRLYNSKGDLIDEKKTNRNGNAVFEQLAIDDYVLIGESGETYMFSIVANDEQVHKTFTDEDGYIKIVVTDATGASIPGSEYGIYNTDGDLIDTLITDANGQATSGKLKKGEYYIVDLADTTNKYYVRINNRVQTTYIIADDANNSSGETSSSSKTLKESQQKQDLPQNTSTQGIGNTQQSISSEMNESALSEDGTVQTNNDINQDSLIKSEIDGQVKINHRLQLLLLIMIIGGLASGFIALILVYRKGDRK